MDVYGIMMQSPVAMCIFRGNDYILEFANDFYLQVIGKEKNIVGKPLFESFPELKTQGIKGIIDEVMASGVPYTINEHEAHLIKDGKSAPHFFNCVYQPFREENGDITGVIVVFTEVTELVIAQNLNIINQKRLVEALSIANIELTMQKVEKGERAVELGIANVELAFQKDEKRKRAVELNIANIELAFQDDEKEKRAVELSIANIELSIANMELAFQDDEKEKRAEELIVANLELVFQNKEKEKRAQELSLANIELVFQNKEKEKRAQELIVANLELVFQNKEKEKRAQELVIADKELAFQNKEKEKREFINKELGAAKTQAENATKIAEDAVKAKQQFLSNMSHEIRTPMNAIIGFTKVVLKTDLSAKQREYLNAIKISGDALIVLINDILDLAKVDAGKMVFEKIPFKLAISLSAMLHLFETKIQEKNLQLIKKYDNRIPEVLLGDPVRLHQIILNLVSNAVKFTSEGSITVSVSLLNEDEKQATVEFAVADTGVGIRADKLEKIFDNFQQASSNTARLFGGTGLGLAIVKQLVEPQGGTMTVKSTVGEGTTFSFTLSFQKTDAKAEMQSDIEEMNTEIKNIKVLVVEDMALNQLLMKTVLDDFGFERDIAENGKIAIDMLTQKDDFGATKAYDIVLMDLQMPVMNGFETTEYIRNTLKSKIPIIALTADVTTVDLAKCKAVGMNDYIAKPIDERVLYNKIVGLVKKKVLTQDEKAHPIAETRCTNLSYLRQRTKSNPKLMSEMILAYLEQTPLLISNMTKSFHDKDWTLLHSAVHKMIPSFLIMGMSTDFENMAKKVVEYARTQVPGENIADLIVQLDNICLQACAELKEELNALNR